MFKSLNDVIIGYFFFNFYHILVFSFYKPLFVVYFPQSYEK